MPTSKDIRNLIITLVILAAGIWIMLRIAGGFIGTIPSGFGGIGSSLESIGTILTLGIAVLIVILIILYFAKRSDEKKQQARQAGYPPQRPQPRYQPQSRP